MGVICSNLAIRVGLISALLATVAASPSLSAPPAGPKLGSALGPGAPPSLTPLPESATAAAKALRLANADTSASASRPAAESIDATPGRPLRQPSLEMPSPEKPAPEKQSPQTPSPETCEATEPDGSASGDPDQPAAAPADPLPRAVVQLGGKIQRCLDRAMTTQLNTRDDSAWSIMHALIGLGVDSYIRVGGPQGREVNSISWLCGNGLCRGGRLLQLRDGQLNVRLGPGFQGHEGQLLAMLAQSRVMIDYPIVVERTRLTVADLAEAEQLSCRPKSELTFKLIGLSHYLDSDATWKDSGGGQWSISRLIQEELAQPINGVTCGGTHRLMGFSYSVAQRKRGGKPVTGQWLRAQKFVQEYHQYAFRLQNRDGSFSTIYFRGRENRPDPDRRLETSGHILEWLVYSLPAEELTAPRTLHAVQFVADLVLSRRMDQWPVGPRGHAIRALALYQQRVFGVQPGQRRPQLAQKTGPRQGRPDDVSERTGRLTPRASSR